MFPSPIEFPDLAEHPGFYVMAKMGLFLIIVLILIVILLFILVWNLHSRVVMMQQMMVNRWVEPEPRRVKPIPRRQVHELQDGRSDERNVRKDEILLEPSDATG